MQLAEISNFHQLQWYPTSSNIFPSPPLSTFRKDHSLSDSQVQSTLPGYWHFTLQTQELQHLIPMLLPALPYKVINNPSKWGRDSCTPHPTLSAVFDVPDVTHSISARPSTDVATSFQNPCILSTMAIPSSRLHDTTSPIPYPRWPFSATE